MPEHSFYHLANPLFTGEKVAPNVYKIRSEVLGTAIFLGGGFFLTAGHVIDDMRANSDTLLVGIYAKGATHFWSARIVETEVLPRDLAVFTAEPTADCSQLKSKRVPGKQSAGSATRR